MASSSYPSSPEFDPEPVQEPYSFKDATNDEVFEELSSRFILNLPEEEMNSQARLCFQVEQAHWYYEDFVRETNPSFQQLSFKKFLAKLIEYCPVLHQIEDSERAVADFMEYKKQVPVCGAIMLNPPMDKCVLVKGWKASSGWGFPKGKINETEPPHLCAIREVLEETGYNLAGQLDQDTPCLKVILHEQLIRLYVVAGIPEDYPFQTKTRKEISKIDWFKLTDLPTWKRNKQGGSKFYMVTPFIGPLKKTINTLRGNGSLRNMKPQKSSKAHPQASRSEPPANATSQDSTLQASSDSNQVYPPHPQQSVPVSETVEDKIQLNGQLAQLLSGLKLSAMSADKGKETEVDANKANPVAESSAAHLDDSATLPTVSQRLPQPSERPALSLPRTTSAKSESSHPSAPLVVPTNLIEVQSSQSSQSLTYSTTSSGNLAPASQSARVGVKSPLPPTTSPTSSSSRRTSSTADISPYLSRATEVPTSAKILKQISLLETVADESARLAPIIAARAAMASRGAFPSGYPLPTSSVPPPSVPPQLPFANSRDMGVLYSSAHPGLPASAAGFHPRIPVENPAFGNPDPFQVRSRTSQAVHRTSMHNPTGSVSMNQNHLLSAINSARVGPVSPVGAQFYPQPLPLHAYPALPPRAPPLGHTMHGYAPLQPLSISPYPTTNLSMPPNMSAAPNPPNPSSMSLLSVLNARPSQ